MSLDEPLKGSLDSARFVQSIGDWNLLAEIGRGAYGVVYRAKNRVDGRDAALKVLLDSGKLDPRDVKRFEREIAALARLGHPGIVRVLDAGKERGRSWVALELVEGRPLRDVKLPTEELVMLLARVARAVGAVHKVGIVHRDLKPMNVLVDAKGEPRVVDFGLAFDARLDASRLSRTGEIQGTPAYLAPEVVKGESAPDDPRRDVYALGVMLHERLKGAHPLVKKGDGAMQVFAKAAKGVPLLAGTRGLDAELAHICDRACALDPTTRLPDGDCLALELETWLARRRPARRRSPVPAIVALGVLSAVVTALAVSSRAPVKVAPPPRPAPLPPPPPPPPPDPKRAPENELEELEGTFGPALHHEASLEGAIERGAALAARYPEDPRARFFGLLARAAREGGEFSLRRELVRLMRATKLPWRDLVMIGIYFRTTGFDRAACCVGEEAYPKDEDRPTQLANFQMHFHLLADDPVRDAVRAEALADRLLARKTDADADEYPERYLLHMAKASAAIGQGAGERAAAALEAASRETRGRMSAHIAGEAARLRHEAVDPETMGATFVATISFTEFLHDVSEQELRGLDGAALPAARVLGSIGDDAARRGRPEHSALARLRAARLLRRAGEGREARALLEDAFALALPLDTKALVERALAHELLVDAPADARRAEELALDAASATAEFDPRTPCEVADAWALVARARLARGDREGARAALAAAEKLAPRDRRELDALSSKLEK